MPTLKLSTSDNLLICTACGAQYDVEDGTEKDECRICDDPRQFVPSSGQSFTTLARMRKDGFKNKIEQSSIDSRVWEIWTEPKFGIGQRACLLQTDEGNVLWDLLALLDEETVEKITSLGPLKAIVISHPHFYTTWADWSLTFHVPVYFSAADSVWANRMPHSSKPSSDIPLPNPKLLTEPTTVILPTITAIICGGHFDGSIVLHFSPPSCSKPLLFIADAFFAVPSAFNPIPHKVPGQVSYSFYWSIPNAIPLPPDKILQIWRAIKPFEFVATFGVFAKSSNVVEKDGQHISLKQRVLNSAKVAVKAMGYTGHEMEMESL